MNIFIITLIVCIAVVKADFCTPLDSSSEPDVSKILLPDEFSARIEVVDKVKTNKVLAWRMFYSKLEKTIRLDMKEGVQKRRKYFFFKTNEILTFDQTQGRGVCTVDQNLGGNVDPYLIGGMGAPSAHPAFPDPLAVVHFTGGSGFPGNPAIVHKKLSTSQTIRGKKTWAYESCQKWATPDKKTDTTVTVTHFFADDSLVFPVRGDILGLNKMSTLLAVTVEGSGFINGKAFHASRSYNFFDFKVGNDITTFETPDGVVCPGRTDTTPFPKLPPYIHMTTEIVDHTIRYLEDIYDYNRKIAIRTIQHQQRVNDQTTETLRFLYDFSSGLLYTVARQTQSCTVSNITQSTSHMFNSDVNGNIKEFTPTQFFRADSKDFSYLGKKTIRGLKTDTFVAYHGSKAMAVGQWHFAPKLTSPNNQNQDFVKNNWAYPIQFKSWSDNTTTDHTICNIFNVRFTETNTDYNDLTPCFKYKQHFQLVIKGTQATVINVGLSAFKLDVQKALEKTLNLRWLYINGIKLYYLRGDIALEFFVVSNEKTFLDQVVTKINTALKNKSLFISIKDPKTGNMTQLPFTEVDSVFVDKYARVKQRPAVKNGYGAGAMAGVAIGTLVAGAAIGGGGSFGYKRFVSP